MRQIFLNAMSAEDTLGAVGDLESEEPDVDREDIIEEVELK